MAKKKKAARKRAPHKRPNPTLRPRDERAHPASRGEISSILALAEECIDCADWEGVESHLSAALARVGRFTSE